MSEKAREIAAKIKPSYFRGTIMQKAAVREIDQAVAPLVGLLEIAECPNRGCVDGAYPDHRGEPGQCQWCDERKQALKGWKE